MGCPIAVHGGSGIPDDKVLRMVQMGIGKLNVGTELFDELSAQFMSFCETKG